MLFQNSVGKWPALIVISWLVLAIVVGFLYVDPEAISNQPTLTECAEGTSESFVQKQVGTFTGREWTFIAGLIGVIIGMIVGIALSRPHFDF